VGGATVARMNVMNFVSHSDCRWVLLPALLWLAAPVVNAREA
jgi:hypothetical protein